MARSCTFCNIIDGKLPAFKIYEDEHILAFLDILPIRRGHTLLIPKVHHAKMTTLPDKISAHMALKLPRLCRAVCKVTEQPDFNLVNNNGYAQVVHHVHWHIVPAPEYSRRTSAFTRSSGLSELANRHDLDDDSAEELAARISKAMADEEEKSKASL